MFFSDTVLYVEKLNKGIVVSVVSRYKTKQFETAGVFGLMGW